MNSALADGLEDDSGMNKEHRDLLLGIKTVSEKLRLEITGGSASPSGESVGVADDNSLKNVLEKILAQLEAMNSNIEDLRSDLMESAKLKKETRKLHVKRKDRSAVLYPVVEIQLLDKLSWRTFLLNKVTTMLQHLRIPVDGNSLKGTTLALLARTIPRYIPKLVDWQIHRPTPGLLNCEKEMTEFHEICSRLHKRQPIIMEFCNYSDFELSNPQLLFITPGSNLELMDYVRPWTKELICLYAGENEKEIHGLCSYDIHTLDLRLIVRFEYFYSISSHKWEFYFGLAFSPLSIPFDALIFTKEVPDLATTEINFDKDSDTKVLQNKKVLATAALFEEEGIDALLLRIRILKWTQQLCVTLDWKPINDGNTFPESSFDQNNNESVFKSKVGCIVEIENRLNVTLQDFKWQMDQATEYVLLPPVITSFSREMFYVLDEKSTKGIITYQIENTDLRMAVVFWTQPERNQFSCGFISNDSVTDAATMNSLMISEKWKTCPYIFTKAEDGTQVLEYRNLRITAVMTTDLRASLKLNITAF